nr:hypothetical protein [Enterococcus faecium]
MKKRLGQKRLTPRNKKEFTKIAFRIFVNFGSLSIRTDEAVQNQIWVRMNLILAQIFCYFTLIN